MADKTVRDHVIELLKTAISDLERGDRVDALDQISMAQRAIRATFPGAPHDLTIEQITRNCKFGSWRLNEFLDDGVLDVAGYTAERFLIEATNLINNRLKGV